MQFTTTVKPAKKQTVDVAAIESALIESYDKMGAALESMLDLDIECDKCLKAMDDCGLAIESLKKYGVTTVAMDLFNGSNHNLDNAVGLENLALESIKSLSAEAKTALKDKYVAGLENAFTDAIKTFIITIKKWFAQFANWIRETFNSSAKLVKLVEQINIATPVNDVTISGVSTAQKDEIYKLYAEIDAGLNVPDPASTENAASVNGFEKAKERFGDEFKQRVAAAIKKESKTVADLGWKPAAVNEAAKKFKTFATKTGIMNSWKISQKAYNEALAAANKAAGGDKPSSELAKKKFEFVKFRGMLVSAHNKMTKALGTTLLTVAKASTKKREDRVNG